MKIAWLSDFDMRQSGYFRISEPMCLGLHELGHEIKVIGLGYSGEEHYFPFTIIPAINPSSIFVILDMLYRVWTYDVLVVALDIPSNGMILDKLPPNRPFKYVGIFAFEAPPLCQSYGAVLLSMDKAFVISRFGYSEIRESGIECEYLHVGLENVWKPLGMEEKQSARDMMGIGQEEFVVLTIADNQERKNLSTMMEGYSLFAKEYPESRYIMVTRANNYSGWNLYDLAAEFGIHSNMMIVERGIDKDAIADLYNMSDVFLLTSKAEGLGLPILEAMACGLPCIGTRCTAIEEHLANNRGILVEPVFKYRDPFGNGWRYFVTPEDVYKALKYAKENDLREIRNNAFVYVSDRRWNETIIEFDKHLRLLK